MHPLLGALSPCLLKRRHHGLARLGPRLSLRGTGRAATTTGWLAWLGLPPIWWRTWLVNPVSSDSWMIKVRPNSVRVST